MVAEMSVLKLPHTLLHEQADACLAQWVTHCRTNAQPSVVLDASALVEFDSSALAVLLGLRRALSVQGSALQITGMTPRLRELASLYGVLGLLEQA
jgi:phospholipid transport system transporter-binding protein